MYIYIYMYVSIYVYIYIERERDIHIFIIMIRRRRIPKCTSLQAEPKPIPTNAPGHSIGALDHGKL